MFRKFIAVLLIVCQQSLSFAGLLVATGFNMNKEFIAAKLCENRAKPKLNCKGKCYLNKMQKKAEEQKEANDSTLKDICYVLSVHQSTTPLCITCFENYYPVENNNSHCKGWPMQSFQPPGIV